VFEIVSCPPFDCADLLAEEEVRDDDAEDECDGGDEVSREVALSK
jgi:hypothetical protein